LVLGKQAIGGIRFPQPHHGKNYYTDEKDLFFDALRLSQTMTMKASLAGLNRGGAKCTLWRDKDTKKTFDFIKQLAEEVHVLGDQYIAAEDMGFESTDIMQMRAFTPYVAGLPGTYRFWRGWKECMGSGDPGQMTALGIVESWKVCMKFAGIENPAEISVAIQGLGSVGAAVASIAYEHGFRKFYFSELDLKKAKAFAEEFRRIRFYQTSASAISSEKIYDVANGIFAPCAGSGVLTEERVDRLAKAGCLIIAGSANNALAISSVAQYILDQGIMYAHDSIISAGGLINVDDELYPEGYDMTRAQNKTSKTIQENLANALYLSRALGKPTNVVADEFAKLRLSLQQYKVLTLSEHFGKPREEMENILSEAAEQSKKLLSSDKK
jgi:leucine dehydrogenase